MDQDFDKEEYFLEKERIPVFIGKEGSQKKEFEEKFDCKIDVNSDSGRVVIDAQDAVNKFVLKNIITAINLGHNPQSALKLEDENYVIDVIDVKTIVHDHGRLKAVLGRIIGKSGSTRKTIEDVTKCHVAVYDSKVSVIGQYENTLLVHEALEMLIRGSSHKSFYSYLERNKIPETGGLL